MGSGGEQAPALLIAAKRVDSIASEIALHTVKNTHLTKEVKRDTDLPEGIHQHLSAVSPAGGLFALGEKPPTTA